MAGALKSGVALFDDIGAGPLRAVITDFYSRVFPDVMIGFMFAGKDRERLIDKEYELVAALLGAGIKYTGRPMRAAHAQHTIFGGQFERRLQILRETLRDHQVAEPVQREWIEHTQSLRSQITRDAGSECADPGPGLRQTPPPQDPETKIKLGRRQ